MNLISWTLQNNLEKDEKPRKASLRSLFNDMRVHDPASLRSCRPAGLKLQCFALKLSI